MKQLKSLTGSTFFVFHFVIVPNRTLLHSLKTNKTRKLSNHVPHFCFRIKHIDFVSNPFAYALSCILNSEGY